MTTVICPYCKTSHASVATVCPECGVRTNAAPATRPDFGAIVNFLNRRTPAFWVVVMIVGLAWLAGLTPSSSSSSTSSSRIMNASIGASAFVLRITNNDPAAVNHEVIVYLNGTPGFTFKASGTMPAVGQSVTIPLSSFTHNGDRFDPRTMAPDYAWVGGGGFDFVQVRFR
jgi:hypothetical protein